MAVFEFTKEDVGKEVVTADGEVVGLIVDTRGGEAHVEPEPGLTDRIRTTLGWEAGGEDTVTLKGNGVDEPVERVTEDVVYLRSFE